MRARSGLILLLAAVAGLAQDTERLRELCRTLGDENEKKRWAAAWELVKAGRDAVPVLSEILDGEWLQGRQMAVWILGQIKEGDVLPILAKALHDGDEHVRWKAAAALKDRGEAALPVLIEALKGENIQAKWCAAWTLGEIKSAKAVEALANALGDADKDVRWKSAVALAQIGPASLAALEDVLKSGTLEARRCAAWVVGEILSRQGQGPEYAESKAKVEPLLSIALKDEDDEVRGKAASALGPLVLSGKYERNSEQFVRLLDQALSDESTEVQRDAILSVARAVHNVVLTSACVKTNEIVDITLPAEAKGAELVATVYDPKCRATERRGFFGKGWTLRLSPDQEGTWAVKLVLGGKTFFASFECKDFSPHEPLSIAEKSPRFFAAGGTPLHLIAVHSPSLRDLSDGAKLDGFLSRISEAGANCVCVSLLGAGDAGTAHVADGRVSLDEAAVAGLENLLRRSLDRGVFVKIAFVEELPNWRSHCLSGLYERPQSLFHERSLDVLRPVLSELVARTSAYPNVFYSLADALGSNQRTKPNRWLGAALEIVRSTGCTRPIGAGYLSENSADERPPRELDFLVLPAPGPRSDKPVLRELPRGDETLWLSFFGSAGTCVPALPEGVGYDLFRSLSRLVREIRFWELERDDEGILLEAPRFSRYAAAASGRETVVFIKVREPGGVLKLGLPVGGYELSWYNAETARPLATSKGQQNEGAIEVKLPQAGNLLVLRVTITPVQSAK